MYLEHLSLTNFRNYTRLELDLQARVHLFQGPNAQGKTNLLEVIAYLSMTKSTLASSDRQIMNWDADQEVIPHTHAQATFRRHGQEHTIEVTLVKEPLTNSAEDTRLRKQFRVDGVPRRAMDVIGQLNTVLFLPQDIRLIAGSPGERRRYLDVLLCQIDPIYCRNLSRYNRIVTQRNALLRQLKERRGQRAELDFWDEQLVQLGTGILHERLRLINGLNQHAGHLQTQLTGGQEELKLCYLASIDPQQALAEPNQMSARSQNEIGLLFRQTLAARRREERARAATVIGPHRDDLRCLVNGIDLTDFGSRGQQRTTALALKLAEVEIIQAKTGEKPVLLLDDVVSELDHRRCHFLLDAITQAEQVLITTTDLHAYEAPFLGKALLFQINDGLVTPAQDTDTKRNA